jgi:hypothetical protein
MEVIVYFLLPYSLLKGLINMVIVEEFGFFFFSITRQ